MIYQENNKALFLPCLITFPWKPARLTLFDADQILPMDPLIHPLIEQAGFVFKRRRRTSRASSSRSAAGSDSEDPLSGELVEIDLETVWKKMGSVYADFTPVPPNTTLKVELFRRQLRQKTRTGVERNHLMDRMCNTIKSIFTCVSPGKDISQLNPVDFSYFLKLIEA